MGAFLRTHDLSHGERAALSRELGYSVRTLYAWERREDDDDRPPGHPPHTDEARERALLECERVWRDLVRGHDGWRSTAAALHRAGVHVPTKLVQESVARLKRERAARERTRIEERRVHVEVLFRDCVWALDQTHVCRDETGETKALAVRETIAPLTLNMAIGKPAEGKDVVRILERTAVERGGWPLVVAMDNGSENKNEHVEECLRRNQVIALWNLPHTPQHNAHAERGFLDLKKASEIPPKRARRKRVSPQTRTSLLVRLICAWGTLDERTPRAELEGLTPAEIDRLAPRAQDHVRRARFFGDVCQELERAALAPSRPRARRMQEREIIWSALERHGLVTRTRGGCPIPTGKAEGIS